MSNHTIYRYNISIHVDDETGEAIAFATAQDAWYVGGACPGNIEEAIEKAATLIAIDCRTTAEWGGRG